VKGQTGPTLTTAESGGGCACSFSPPPDDRAPAKRERKMSDEAQQEEGKRFRSLGQDGMDGILERHGERVAAQAAAQATSLAEWERRSAQAAALQMQQINQLMAGND
jgi:hypothetical protein